MPQCPQRLANKRSLALGSFGISLRIARQATGDPYLGLPLATAVHPGSLGLLGYAMLSSETFGQALERLIRFWRLKGDGSSLTLERSGPEARLRIQPLALPANYLFEERHPLECSLAALAWPILLADSTFLANFESELERRLRAT